MVGGVVWPLLRCRRWTSAGPSILGSRAAQLTLAVESVKRETHGHLFANGTAVHTISLRLRKVVAAIPAVVFIVRSIALTSTPVARESAGIPVRALAGYRRAAALVEPVDPGCHIDWALTLTVTLLRIPGATSPGPTERSPRGR